MIDSDRKLLTEEVLGEIWKPGLVGLPYAFEGKKYSNRAFTTPQDSHNVCKALMEKGKWRAFYYITKANYMADVSHGFFDEYFFVAWLLIESPERTCQLAVDFLKAIAAQKRIEEK